MSFSRFLPKSQCLSFLRFPKDLKINVLTLLARAFIFCVVTVTCQNSTHITSTSTVCAKTDENGPYDFHVTLTAKSPPGKNRNKYSNSVVSISPESWNTEPQISWFLIQLAIFLHGDWVKSLKLKGHALAGFSGLVREVSLVTNRSAVKCKSN